MSTERITHLVGLALSNKASLEELEELTAALKNDEDGTLSRHIAVLLEKEKMASGSSLPESTIESLIDEILEADRLSENDKVIPLKQTPVKHLWRKIAAAVVIIFLVGSGIYLLSGRLNKTEITAKDTTGPGSRLDQEPGGNRAVLTLADGSTIVLDSMANGAVSTQGNAKIIKAANSQLVYNNMLVATDHNELLYNTVTTPRGGQYQVVLSDGTKVWLNAVSSLRFSTGFTGKQRVVELTGEGYFEVTKNASRPFIVKTSNLSVEVLGTHFNVSAYKDEENSKTTLLEGSIRITSGSSSNLLQPGQQVSVNNSTNEMKLVKQANTEEAVAWKEGYFQFSGADLPVIMRQIARWYDVDVVYEGESRKHNFFVKIDHNKKLSSIVNALQQGGINCRMEEGKLIVSP